MSDLTKVTTVPKQSEENFVFGFNDFDFSDRILRLEITPEDVDDNSNKDEDSPPSRKKLKVEQYNDRFSCIQKSTDSKSSAATRVTTLHICSLVLAAKSPFFYKLFKNGMRESQQKTEVCLKINASEEAILMDLFRFMYGNCALNATSFDDLLYLLIAADKFEVNSCMSHCVEMLFKFPMSLKHALFCLELPSSVSVSEIVKPLLDAAKKYVFILYKDFTKSQDEAMKLPLSAIEVVLGSVGLQVASEDNIFDFVLKWARTSYPEQEERREILTKRLSRLICFPNMSVAKLKEVLACVDFDHDHVSKLVHEAVFSKVERSYVHLIHDSVDLSTTQCGSAGRVYRPHCVVFFDLTRGQCDCLSVHKTGSKRCAISFEIAVLKESSNRIDSPVFRLGGKMIYLSVCCVGDNEGIGLSVHKAGLERCTISFEIAVLKESSREFESKLKVNNHTVVSRSTWGSTPNYLGFTKTELMRRDCDYIINGVLCLRAEITLLDS